MAKISIYLDKRRKLKDGRFPLTLRLSHFDDTRTISLKINLRDDEWNQKSNEIRKIQNSKRETAAVQSKLSKAQTYLVENESKILRMSMSELKGKVEFVISPNTDEAGELSDYLQGFGLILISRTMLSGKRKTANWYEDGINSIIEFNLGQDLRMGEITVTLLEQYKAHCLNKGHSKNSISARLRAIRAILNKAKKENLLPSIHNPFANFQIPSQKTAKRAVSKDTIAILRQYTLEEYSGPWHNRNYFLFMFNLQGMNFADIAKLRVQQISNGRLNYVRSKTGKKYDVKLTTEAIAILKHYLANKKNDDLVFPILKKEIINDPVNVSKDSDQALHVFNNNLRKLAKKCGIEEKVTSYVARHSWASAARKLGVSTDVIGDALGHENYSTTEVYLQEFDSSVLDEVNELVTA